MVPAVIGECCQPGNQERALKEAGKPVQVRNFETGSDSVDDEHDRIEAYDLVAGFLAEHLKP